MSDLSVAGSESIRFVECKLVGWGSVAWPRLVEAASGYTCAWADYDGFHIGDCPTRVPPYSHIWGWSADGALMRGRIDGDQVIVGWLYPGDHGEGDIVKCLPRDLITWRAENKRTKIRFVGAGTSWPEKMRLVEVLDEHRVSFIGA